MNMTFLLQYAFRLITDPYHWGGDDPIMGFDCSGFVQELLMAAGVIKRVGSEKLNALTLFNWLMQHGGSQGTFGAGSIAFFGKSVTEISHVGFCIDSSYMLHYGSGDHTTTSADRAAEQNAFGRMDLIRYRADFLCVVKPAYRTPG
jgi:peptidoglycan endopeptidase LytE